MMTAEAQFSVGPLSARSMTSTSVGTLLGCSLRPSCCWTAVVRLGAESSVGSDTPSGEDGGVALRSQGRSAHQVQKYHGGTRRIRSYGNRRVGFKAYLRSSGRGYGTALHLVGHFGVDRSLASKPWRAHLCTEATATDLLRCPGDSVRHRFKF